jgi:hypothetical protein
MTMKKFAIALAAAAAFGLAAPTMASAASTVVVKPAAHAVVVKKSVRDFSARRHCRVVIVKKHRGHRVIVTKVRRCW